MGHRALSLRHEIPTARKSSRAEFVRIQRIPVESAVDREQFRRYLAAKNVHEFVAAGQTVQVIGPAVFSGDLPDETPVSARIESGRVHDGAFELKLSNLATNKPYVIESSYELKTGSSAMRWSESGWMRCSRWLGRSCSCGDDDITGH